MMIRFRFQIRFQNRKDPLNRILNPQQLPEPKFFQTLKMVDVLPSSRRPTCPSCSKPARFCLCSRLQSPGLENSVGVIILQHSLERKHPLNSARIAKLGLKNVKIATVSDVNFEARFTIRLREPNCEVCPLPNASNSIPFDTNEECSFRNGIQSTLIEVQNQCSSMKSEAPEASQERDEGAVITTTIGKYGIVNYFDHMWMQETSLQKLKNIDEVLTSPAIRGSLEKGFIVKKLQKRQLNGSKELEEYKEFEIEVPPKSVLLFPSENAFSVDGFDATDFDVNNLIVLDGTWAKAKRMYNENPWLRLLPHMKLDFDKMSLYSDVRHQPKIGFLSTIESIVYALKVIGDNPEGLDSLLDVFESMIGVQRRCKDERMKSTCQVQAFPLNSTWNGKTQNEL